MTSNHKRLIAAAMLAAIGFAASAQPAPPAGPASAPAAREYRMGQRDPAKMQAWAAKRLQALKATLKITPAQEGAWTTFSAAMTPPANLARPSRADFDKLTTPERIDKMRALRTQHMAEMDKRADAAKAFYATLTPEQQKTFDAQRMGHGHHGMRGGMGMHGMNDMHHMHDKAAS